MADHQAPVQLPRVAITYCTQCKWMLRAAYYAQELMSTFGTSIGEVALIPATGGLFTVYLTHRPINASSDEEAQVQEILIWDRKAEGGFPETKILKQKIRNHIEPDKNLGHSDTPSSKAQPASGAGKVKQTNTEEPINAEAKENEKQGCEDCK